MVEGMIRKFVAPLIVMLSMTCASTAQTTAPAAAGARAGSRPLTSVGPLPDAASVELAPPLDKPGNFKIAPKTRWADVPPVAVKEGTPRGTVSTFAVKS